MCIPMQDGRNFARRTAIIRRRVPSTGATLGTIFKNNLQKKEARDPGPDLEVRQDFWTHGRLCMAESCCSKGEPLCSDGRFSDTSDSH